MKYRIYQRVSTEKQQVLRQEYEISNYCQLNGIDMADTITYKDIITGKVVKRVGYQKMKSEIEAGDILIILDLDRLGRNWDLIKKEWKSFTDSGVYIIVVNCPLINVLPSNDGAVSIDRRLIQEMVFTLLCYVSQKEVEKTSSRTKEALAAKRASGVVLGRPSLLNDTIKNDIIQDRISGMAVKDIVVKYNITKPTMTKVLKEAGLVREYNRV